MSKRIVIPTMSWVHGAGHAPQVSDPISGNPGVWEGTIIGYKVVASDCNAAQSIVITFQDEDGDTIYTFADTISKNTTTLRTGLLLPVHQKETITIDPSADAGGATTLTVKVVLIYVPDPRYY